MGMGGLRFVPLVSGGGWLYNGEEKGGKAMLTVIPDYYPRFQCAAERCRHTCCAGWEIDIDEESLARFRSTEGAMGERLRAAIEEEPEPHFILGEGERCPFLNERGLCELIIYGGERELCQICADHPRFRSFLPSRTEIGLGLCCEAAGELILGWREPVAWIASGEPEEEDEEERYLLSLRENVFALAQDRELSLRTRMEAILRLCGSGVDTDPLNWIGFYRRLERLEESWDDVLDAVESRGANGGEASFLTYMQGRETEYEQLLVYFLYRHFLTAYDDGDVAGKAAFAVLSVRFLMRWGAALHEKQGAFSFADQVECARRYSGEIEYSQENLDAFFEALAEE